MRVRTKKRWESFIILLLILGLIAQAIALYFIYEQMNAYFNFLHHEIIVRNRDLQSKINAITTSLSSVSSVQSSLQEEVGKIKASVSSDFSDIINMATKGVVTIKTDVSQGTGFFITNDGYIVTNYHIIEGARAAAIFTYDSRQYPVKLIGSDVNMDISLLKIEGDNFFSLKLGDSDDVKIGEKVVAIGNPFGLAFTATEGIISARDRRGINNLPYYFQTDVALNPGNSGGPLINAEGEVIGINNFKVSGADNIGFALEINYAIDSINRIALQTLNKTIIPT